MMNTFLLSTLSSSLLLILLTLTSPSSAVLVDSEIQQFQSALQNQAGNIAQSSLRSVQAALSFLKLSASLPSPEVQVTTDPGVSCPSGTQNTNYAVEFLDQGLGALSSDLIGAIGSTVVSSSSSQTIAFSVVKTFPDPMAKALTVAGSILNFEGGMGAGFGMEIYCGDELLVTLGGGGGGGISVSSVRIISGGVGGGGGAQTDGNRVDVGGGTGCPFEAGGTPFGCEPTADPSGSSFEYLASTLRYSLETCRTGLAICGGGGGGAGFSYESGVFGTSTCSYGGGFGFSFSAAVSLEGVTSTGNDTKAVPSQHLRGTGTVTGSVSSEAEAVSCPSDSYDQITKTAAADCNAECVGKSSYFNACYCPCFKGKIESAGLSWGYTMSCAS